MRQSTISSLFVFTLPRVYTAHLPFVDVTVWEEEAAASPRILPSLNDGSVPTPFIYSGKKDHSDISMAFHFARSQSSNRPRRDVRVHILHPITAKEYGFQIDTDTCLEHVSRDVPIVVVVIIAMSQNKHQADTVCPF